MDWDGTNWDCGTEAGLALLVGGRLSSSDVELA